MASTTSAGGGLFRTLRGASAGASCCFATDFTFSHDNKECYMIEQEKKI